MTEAPAPSPTPVPPAPPWTAFGISALFELRDARRPWPFAARASLCMGMPVIVGVAAGDVAAGLMATIGAFTALYGSGRPYLNRAGYLAVIALAFAAAVGLGAWASSIPWLAIPVVALIATTAAFVCHALRVGPPGAYMFALACAAGTAMPGSHFSPWRAGLLVLAGGGFAWLAHMAGALLRPRAPERAAVTAAGGAIVRFIEALGTPEQDAARHAAALAMHEAWTTLVTHQPARPRPDGTLSRLRGLNRALNLIFVEAVNAAAQGTPMPPSAAGAARRLACAAENPPPGGEHTDPVHIPLGHPGALQMLREGLHPWSPPMWVAVRVGIASTVAGAIGAASGLERAYWAMAAAVLVLHQGFDWVRTLQRGVERLAGTWVGLILAGLILALHPQGLWLAAALMLLQFAIELCVVRNYALAVVFITAAALTIASGGQGVADIGHLLVVRGLDTTLGCAIGLAVFAATMGQAASVRISQELVQTLDAVKAAVEHLARGAATPQHARSARRDLQHRTIALLQAYDANLGASARHRRVAEELWPAVVATQRLAYRVLSAGWMLERSDAAPGMADALFGGDGKTRLDQALTDLAAAIRTRAKPPPGPEVPPFVAAEVEILRKSLIHSRR